jgi:hypothetical protein
MRIVLSLSAVFMLDSCGTQARCTAANCNACCDKTGIGTYLPDTPIANQRAMMGTPATTTSWQRRCTNEASEAHSAGNGITNHNETSEPLDITWSVANKTPGARSVGETP